MSAIRWGALVARAASTLPLLAACSTPQPTPPATPPLPSAPPAAPSAAAPRALPLPPSTPDPDGAPQGLAPPATSLKLASEAYRNYQRGLRFGGGMFAYVGVEQGTDPADPKCAVPSLTPPRCAGFRVAPWSSKTTQDSWPQTAAATLKDWGPWVNSPQDWEQFSPGKSGVYGARRGPYGKEWERLYIDFIDEKGGVSQIASAGTMRDAMVVETPAGLRVIGTDAGEKIWFGLIKEGEVVLSRALEIGDIPAMDYPVSDNARVALAGNKFAAFGPLRALALPPEKIGAEPSIGLVWVDVIPPRRLHRHRDQCARPNVYEFEKTTLEMAGHSTDNACSGGGRWLGSHWARKRLHVTRLSLEGKRLSDSAVALPPDYDAASLPLDLRIEGTKLLIDDRSFDLETKQFGKGAASPSVVKLEGPARAAVASAAFDPASGEGLVLLRRTNIIRSGQEPPALFYSQRFDALGKAVGPMLDLDARPFNAALGPTLARAQAGWFQRTSPNQHDASMLFLPVGKGAGAWLPAPLDASHARICGATSPWCSDETPLFVGIAASEDGKQVSQFVVRSGEVAEDTLALTGDKGETKNELRPWRPYEPLTGPNKTPPGEPRAATLASGGRPLFLAGRLLSTPEGKPIALRYTMSTRRLELERGDGWKTAPGWPDDGKATHVLHEVWGDLVLVVVAGKKATATWLRNDQSVELADEVVASFAPERDPGHPTGEGGPVLSGGRWALPPTPGPALPLAPEAAALHPLCPVALPSGPRRALLVCSEPAAQGQPAAVVTVRPLRY